MSRIGALSAAALTGLTSIRRSDHWNDTRVRQVLGRSSICTGHGPLRAQMTRAFNYSTVFKDLDGMVLPFVKRKGLSRVGQSAKRQRESRCILRGLPGSQNLPLQAAGPLACDNLARDRFLSGRFELAATAVRALRMAAPPLSLLRVESTKRLPRRRAPGESPMPLRGSRCVLSGNRARAVASSPSVTRSTVRAAGLYRQGRSSVPSPNCHCGPLTGSAHHHGVPQPGGPGRLDSATYSWGGPLHCRRNRHFPPI